MARIQSEKQGSGRSRLEDVPMNLLPQLEALRIDFFSAIGSDTRVRASGASQRVTFTSKSVSQAQAANAFKDPGSFFSNANF